MLLLYWEIIQKRKHDGKILDEFMMVCNNLRNDLTHANEYVVGMSLKLIGRIAQRDIMDALLPPIYEKCLNHIEAFVRRNAVECLFSLYNKFGEELLHDLDQKMIDLLATETDINTRRNAIVLLFRVNSLEGLEFVITKLEENNLEDFGDTTQLAIVKYLFDLCDQDPSNKGKYIKILFEFMSSKFSAVLFEISNSLVNYTNNYNALSKSVSQLLSILLKTPDTNVKLIIIEKLTFFKSIGKKLIKRNIAELMKVLEKETSEVKVKTLDIILDLLDDSDVEKFLDILEIILTELYREANPNPNQINLYENLLKSLIYLMKRKSNKKLNFQEESFLELLSTIILHSFTDRNLINLVKNLIYAVLSNRDQFQTDLNDMILDKVLYVKSPEILKTLLSLYIEDMTNEQQA